MRTTVDKCCFASNKVKGNLCLTIKVFVVPLWMYDALSLMIVARILPETYRMVGRGMAEVN